MINTLMLVKDAEIVRINENSYVIIDKNGNIISKDYKIEENKLEYN